MARISDHDETFLQRRDRRRRRPAGRHRGRRLRARRRRTVGFQKQKKLECLTAEDVKHLKNPSSHPDLKELNCQLKSDPKWAGNKVTFTMSCAEDDLRMTITDMTVATDAFTSVTTVTDDKGRMTTMGGKISARRVGECPK